MEGATVSEVVVVCAESSHEGRVVKVATFNREGSAAWEHELLGGPRIVDGQRVHARLDDKLAGASVQLVGNEVNEPPFDDPQPDPAATRRRYELRCELCALGITARAATLHPLLDKAAAAGVSELPLVVLIDAILT